MTSNSPTPAMFHISDVLSLTTGRTLSSLTQKPILPDGSVKPDREGPLYGLLDIIEYVSGEDLGRGARNRDSLIKLSETAEKVKPILKQAFWYLTDIECPEDLNTQEKADAWVATQAKKYGEYLPVYTIKQYNDPSIDTSSKTTGFAAKHPKRNPLESDGTSFGKSVH